MDFKEIDCVSIFYWYMPKLRWYFRKVREMAWRHVCIGFSNLSMCASDSLGKLVKTPIAWPYPQSFWFKVFAFQAGLQMMLILLGQGPNFENYRSKKYPKTWYSFKRKERSLSNFSFRRHTHSHTDFIFFTKWLKFL